MRSSKKPWVFRSKPKEVKAHLRYQFIYESVGRWPVNVLCEVLQTSESGYYRFVRKINKPGKDDVLSAAIQEILNESPYNDNYGIQRMKIALSNKGLEAGLRRITRIMRENGWLHTPQRRPQGLTKVTAEVQERENLIKKDFSAAAPFVKLLTDISQIPCQDGKLYISPIMDCFNGEIIALQMSENMRKELCIDTLKSAYDRFPIKGAILHSDRGSQYTSEAFRSTLKDSGMLQSLSSVDCCYDNARMESFFATLKRELLYRIPTTRMKRDIVKRIIFRYIFTYYNKARIYTSNPGGVPPVVYRQLYESEHLPLAA